MPLSGQHRGYLPNQFEFGLEGLQLELVWGKVWLFVKACRRQVEIDGVAHVGLVFGRAIVD